MPSPWAEQLGGKLSSPQKSGSYYRKFMMIMKKLALQRIFISVRLRLKLNWVVLGHTWTSKIQTFPTLPKKTILFLHLCDIFLSYLVAILVLHIPLFAARGNVKPRRAFYGNFHFSCLNISNILFLFISHDSRLEVRGTSILFRDTPRVVTRRYM